MLKGCVIPVVDDKLTLLCMKNAEMASDVSFSLLRRQLRDEVKLLRCKENEDISGHVVQKRLYICLLGEIQTEV